MKTKAGQSPHTMRSGRTFQRRFLTWILPALAAANILVALAYGALNYTTTREQIIDRQTRGLPVVAASLAGPLWQFQYEAISAMLDSLVNDTDITSAVVRDDKDHVVASVGIDPRRHAVALRAPIIYNQNKITETAGTISITVSLHRAWSSAENGLLAGLAAALASSLAVLLGVISVNHRMIVRPLGVLLAAIEQTRQDGERRRIALTGTGAEIDHVIVTFNEMQERLDRDERERTEITRRLDVALTNMAQGITFYGPDGELLLLNQRCVSLLELPADLIRPGMYFHDIVPILKSQNIHPETAVGYDATEFDLRPEPMNYILSIPSGRIVYVSYEPLADGGWVRTYDDITERRRKEQEIAYLARHDVLSGLPNRSTFGEKLQSALGHLARGTHFAVLCLDLDRFKQVNDTMGHAAGDALLKAVSERLSACIRDVDIVARLGGDEFAILQFGIKQQEDPVPLASRIIRSVSAPYEIDGQEVVIGVSIGIALAPGDGSSASDLMKKADMALYRAKAEGRGMFRFFEGDMDASLQVKRQMEIDLNKAIARDQFELHYQPVMNIRERRIVGFEALIRWRHPERGLMLPDLFIPLAEETGLIVEIGAWALRTACQEAATWPGDLRIAVNLSPVQFKKKGLVPAVVDALEASRLARGRLELEVTENVLISDIKGGFEVLQQLRDLGGRIVLDDFGTGYSSLSYLRQFRFDKIKIDRSFVHDVTTQAESAAIIRAVVALGASLGVGTTAEGVETTEQLMWLQSEGCTEAQGHLFSKPRPRGEIAELIRTLSADGRELCRT